MNNLKEKVKVFFAHSYEEAKAIELSQKKVSLKSLLLRLFIVLWLIGANALLNLLRRILFGTKKHTYEDVRNIVVYTVGTLGDNVLMLPAVAAIKKHYPKAKLTVITNCDGFGEYAAKQIWGSSLFVDDLITIPTHPVQRHGRRLVFPPIMKYPCDLFINLSPFGNRGWMGAVVRELLFAKWYGAKKAIGFKMSSYKRKHYFNNVQHHFVQNEARRPIQILRELGIKAVENGDLWPVDTDAVKSMRDKISPFLREPSQCVIILNPGAKLKASWWPAERYGKLAAWLSHTYKACILINGTVDEKEQCDKVVEASGGAAYSLAGELSIQELIELLRMSALCITNNTGPMTLAAMAGTPHIVLASTRFSPTFYMPISDKMIWLFSFTKSSYSYDDTTETSIDMLNIKVNHVICAVKKLLQLPAPDNMNKLQGAFFET